MMVEGREDVVSVVSGRKRCGEWAGRNGGVRGGHVGTSSLYHRYLYSFCVEVFVSEIGPWLTNMFDF